MKITFTDTLGVAQEYKPQPAHKLLPDWYKNTKTYENKIKQPDGNGGTTATIKKCMPVFDVMNAGYFLVTHTDVFVSSKINIEGQIEPWYEWSSFTPISFHNNFQATLHPKVDNNIPKYFNPWSIKTPKGYSSLFIAPAHRDNVFEAFPGIVDTDTYHAPVNIVFVLKDKNFEGLVPAGTPICQVIPFKRDAWEMEIGTKKDVEAAKNAVTFIQSKFFDAYKTFFRQNKEYK
jgi:hypothetical protein